MALTTATTSEPCRRVRAMWSATARIRSASPTEVPPNFWTTSGIRTRLQTAHRPDGAAAARSRTRAAGPRWAIRGGPRDWVGSRAVPSDKRARQRAAREARLAAEAKQQKRRRQIRNGVLVVVVAGVIVGIAFLVSGGNKQRGLEVQRDHHHDGGRQAADAKLQAQAERRRGQGRLPGQHQDPTVNHPEVLGRPAHDHRHVQDLHGHGHHHRRDLHIALDAKAAPEDGQQLRLPGRQGLLPLRDLPPGHPGLHGPDRRPDRNRGGRPGYTIPDELPAKAANPASSTRSGRWPWPTRARPTRRQPVLHRGRAGGRDPAQHLLPLRVRHIGHERGRHHQPAGFGRAASRPTSPSASSPSRSTNRKDADHGHPHPTRRRRLEPPAAEVRRGAADGHRHEQALRRHHGHLARHHGHRARPPRRAEDGQQLRVPGPLPLLRRRRVPPHHPGLRAPGRRPHRDGLGRPGLPLRRRAAGGRALQGRLAGHGQRRARTPTAASSS